MAGQLTERQQEIKQLLDRGATPKQVADALGITENAVYQQRRRIKDGGAPASRSRKTQGSSRKVQAMVDKADANLPRPVTPLEAVRARRKGIHEELSTTEAAVVAADKVLKQAQEAHAKATQRYADELTQLDTAEAVLSGKAPKARTQSRKRADARKPAPAPAATTDAPATSNGAAEAEVAHAAAEAPQTEERPGVPTVAEFAQADDAFGDAA